MIDLFNYPLVAILCTGLVIILAATEFGRRLGMNANRKVEDDISTLEAAMLGLLALIIGFTFAMALSRFDTRRDAMLRSVARSQCHRNDCAARSATARTTPQRGTQITAGLRESSPRYHATNTVIGRLRSRN
jgi:hypothetical protein